MAGRKRQKRGPKPYSLSRELRAIKLIGGGPGCVILVTTAGKQKLTQEWISQEAIDALIRAASRLGYRGGLEGWGAVAESMFTGGLSDVLSEAIEEAETQ